MEIFVQILENGVIPNYANDGDAGMDIRASEDVLIHPQETKIIKTGLKIAVPKGVVIDVRPRSGLSLKTPLRISNSPGTIDSGYRDEIGIIVENTSLEFSLNEDDSWHKNSETYTIDEKGNKKGSYLIKKGDRIAQLVFLKYETVSPTIVEDVSIIGENRGGGFGSSGIK